MGVHTETRSGSNRGVMTSLQGMQWSAQHGHVFGVEMKEGLAPSRWREIGRGTPLEVEMKGKPALIKSAGCG